MTWNSQEIKGIQWSGTDGGRHEDYVDYLDRYGDIKAGANRWLGDQSNTHWANYVRQRGGMFNDFQHNTKYGKPTGGSMWDYGYSHAQEFGYKTNRDNWKVLGRGDMPRAQMAIGDDIYDFAKWHWENIGSNEPGRTLRDMDDVRAQDAAAALQIANAERDEKNRLFEEGLEEERAAAMQKAAEGAEAGRLASRRGGGSQTLGASGAATFKGKGLKSSENKRGKGRGTGQLRRPYGASNLSIAAGTGAGQRQGTGLNRAGLG